MRRGLPIYTYWLSINGGEGWRRGRVVVVIVVVMRKTIMGGVEGSKGDGG